MAVNKVIYYNTTLIDLTNTTATADTILQGYGAYGKDGEWIDGTAKSGGGTDTSQANATNASIVSGMYAYVDGERIEGEYIPQMYNMSSGNGLPSSSVEQSYTVSEIAGGSEQYFYVDGNMALSGSRYSYDITGWNSSLQSGTKYGLFISIYNSAEYDGEYSNFSYIYGGTSLPLKLKATKTIHGEDDIVTFEHIDVYVTDTTLYTDDLSDLSGVGFYFEVDGIGYEGIGTVYIEPYTLVEKTVTPLTQTQIVRSSSKIASVTDYLPMDATTLQAYGFTISSSRTIYNFPSNLILTEGVTYRINARYHRYADDKDYVFNALLKAGSIMTIVLSLTNPTTTTEVELSLFQRYLELSTLSDSIANRQLSSFYLDISTENIEADALGQVTVNAIPSNYVDTSSATATATDILSGATAFVNGSLVTGSLVVNSYYTGSGVPSSSLGNDGDIYFDIS